MKRFLLFLFLTVSLFGFSQDKLKYSQAKIFYSKSSDLEVLIAHGVGVDNGKAKQNTYIESVFSEDEINKAKSLGFKVEVSIPDWESYYHEVIKDAPYTKSPAPCGSTDYTVPAHFNLGSMGGYLNYTEVLAELDEMQSLYPQLITVKAPISTYTTAQNRPIYWVKISDNPNTNETEPEALYTSLHHAREPGSLQTLIFYMWYLLENYQTNPTIQALVDQSEIFFIPIVNPDGYAYNSTNSPTGGGNWRKNRRNNGDGSYGVDNNRNYNYHFGETGVSTSPSGDTWPGTAAFSEPENQAIKWFVEQHQFKIAINAHTYSNLLLFPYSWQTGIQTPDHDLFLDITDIMVQENGFTNQISSALYPASGDSDDWMYAETSTHDKIFAMTPEIGSAFWISQSAIIPQCKEMVHLNMTALKLIHNTPLLTDESPSTTGLISNNFSYQLKNLSIIDTPANFTVSITPLSSNIASIGNDVVHNNIVKLGTTTGSINYTLNPGIQQGETVMFKVSIDNGLYITEVIIEKTFGNFTNLLLDNGNNVTTNWTSTWSTTSSTYVSPSSSITDSASGNYANYANKTITLKNALNLTNTTKALCTFYAKWDLEVNYDYVQFEVSTDNGTSWQPQCGLFTNAGVDDQNVAGEPLYDGTQTSWVLEEIPLDDYLGQSIKCRFQLVSDNGVTADGFYFDDFTVKTISTSTVGIDPWESLELSLVPNPAKESFSIQSNLIMNDVKVSIYNITGQLVHLQTLKNTDEFISVGSMETGVYWVNISNASGTKTLKLIIQ
ncbi:MAG: immune inhibitor A [Flavobacteriaceae bacterium]|nr:immune inhibitor A [Flavobacteriaceae bacterium]